MKEKTYMGDVLVDIARKATVNKILKWKRIPSKTLNKLQDQIAGRFEDGFMASFDEFEGNANLIIVKTNSEIPSRRYLIAFYEFEENRMTPFPPSEFRDPVYVSGVVALYQLVEGIVNAEMNENFKKNISILSALIKKNNGQFKQ